MIVLLAHAIVSDSLTLFEAVWKHTKPSALGPTITGFCTEGADQITRQAFPPGEALIS